MIPIANYDEWKLETPEDERDRLNKVIAHFQRKLRDREYEHEERLEKDARRFDPFD
jgi:hypothetical protein